MKALIVAAPVLLALASGPVLAQMSAAETADLSRDVWQARPVHQAEISEGMQTLISEFVRASIRMAATDISGDAEAIGIVAHDRTRALAALAFHPPQNMTELAAKLAAITEFSEDTERFSLRMLVEDATRLAAGAE